MERSTTTNTHLVGWLSGLCPELFSLLPPPLHPPTPEQKVKWRVRPWPKPWDPFAPSALKGYSLVTGSPSQSGSHLPSGTYFLSLVFILCGSTKLNIGPPCFLLMLFLLPGAPTLLTCSYANPIHPSGPKGLFLQGAVLVFLTMTLPSSLPAKLKETPSPRNYSCLDTHSSLYFLAFWIRFLRNVMNVYFTPTRRVA